MVRIDMKTICGNDFAQMQVQKSYPVAHNNSQDLSVLLKVF